MATEIRFAANVIRHDNHTAPGSLTQRTFTQKANFILLVNTHATASANISFDGSNTFTLNAGTSLALDFTQLISYYTSSSGSATLQVLYGSES